MIGFKDLNSSQYQAALADKWQNFIAGKSDDYSMVRPEVFESWKRSRSKKVNPYDIVKVVLTDNELRNELEKYESVLSITRPYVQRLYSMVEGSGAYILVSNKDGFLLDVIGDPDIVARGTSLSRLSPGACRSEDVSGTNAIALALKLNRPVQLWGEEHYVKAHKEYSCAGAPFYDENNNLLGALNVTMLKENAHSHTLGMVVSAADSITREIKLRNTLAKLEALNAQRNLIIENMTSGVFLLTPNGNITQINHVALEMLNLERDLVLGQNLFSFISINNDNDYHSSLKYLNKEAYNREATISVLSKPYVSKRFNISINHIKGNTGETVAILFRINSAETIQKLINRVEGYHAKYDFDDIVGESKAIENLKSACRKAAKTDSSILITGASGTGKELFAQSIHNASAVANGPFVAINCASIPNSLVESELFGYENGAFTGASKEGRPGKFELADGGTIFLDEIGDMPLNVQATLLRVLQTKEVTRIGSNKPKPVNIRVIAATNQDLLKAIDEKNFRSDLYYRLNVFTVNVPSLAERGPIDIKLIADHFVYSYNKSHGTNYCLSSDAYTALESYNWPGNVRQLENVIERAITLADSSMITLDQLPQQIVGTYENIFSDEKPHDTQYEEISRRVEKFDKINKQKELIIRALEKTGGRITDTAALLEINRRTLYRHMDKFSINPEDYRK